MVKMSLLTKLAPESGSGKVKNISSAARVGFSGIGVDQGLKFADNVLARGTLQSIGFNVPVVGRLSLIDIINYIAHNNGNVVPKSTKPFIALGSAKVVQSGRINLLGVQSGSPAGEGPATANPGVGF